MAIKDIKEKVEDTLGVNQKDTRKVDKKNKISNEKITDIEKYLANLNATYGASRGDFDNKLKEYWQRHFGIYSCKKDKDFPFVGSADIQTGVIAYADSNLEARFIAALNSIKFLNISANTSKEANEAGKKVQSFFNNFWVSATKALETVASAFQYDIVEGQFFLKIIPDKRNEKQVKRYKKVEINGFDKDGKPTKTKQYGVGEDNQLQTEMVRDKRFVGATWQNMPSSKVGFDNSVDRIDKCSFIYHEFSMTPSEVRSQKDWIQLDSILLQDKKDTNQVSIKPQSDETPSDDKNQYVGINDSPVNKITFREYYVNYDIDGKGFDKNCIFILSVDKGKLHYYEENSFFDGRKPVVSAPFYRIAGKITGQSHPARLGSLNDEIDTIQDQLVDADTVANTISGTYIPQKGFDPAKFKFSPGKFAPVSNHDIFKQFEFKNNPVPKTAQLNFVMAIYEKMALAADYSMGRESAINKSPTASGTAMLLKEFSLSLSPLMQNVQNALKEAVYQTIQCMYEFMPEEGITFQYRVKDESDDPESFNEETLTREDLEYLDEWVITVLGGAVDVMTESEKQTALALQQIFGQDQTGEIDTFEIKKNLIKTISPRLEKTVIRTPKEIEFLKMLEQRAQEVAQKEQAVQMAAAEVQTIHQELIKEKAQLDEREFEMAMDKAGIPEEEKGVRMQAFRKAYIIKANRERQAQEQAQAQQGQQAPQQAPAQPKQS